MRRPSWIRIAMLLVVPLAVLGVTIVIAPLSSRTAGDTRCFPFLGPRVLVDTSMGPRDRLLALAHESAHAAQCERDGFVRNYMVRLSRRGRLGAEIEAFCAEGRADVELGTRADHVVARVLDELGEVYPWFRGTTRAGFLVALEHRCGDLVAAARKRSPRPLV